MTQQLITPPENVTRNTEKSNDYNSIMIYSASVCSCHHSYEVTTERQEIVIVKAEPERVREVRALPGFLGKYFWQKVVKLWTNRTKDMIQASGVVFSLYFN